MNYIKINREKGGAFAPPKYLNSLRQWLFTLKKIGENYLVVLFKSWQ